MKTETSFTVKKINNGFLLKYEGCVTGEYENYYSSIEEIIKQVERTIKSLS